MSKIMLESQMTRAIPVLALLISSLALPSAGCAGAESRAPDAEEMMRDEIAYLIREVMARVKAERDRHRPNGRKLTFEEKRRLAGFFPPEILDVARVAAVPRIENPGFFSVYEEAGRPLPLDLSGASGLALIDTILVAQRPDSPTPLPLLFHEMVHLGSESYLERYVRSWAEGGRRYRSIAHEDQAFELQARFRARPEEPFSVADEVRQRFGLEPAASAD